jgi:hypothetical protein
MSDRRYLVIKRGPGADLWYETNDLDQAFEWADEVGTDEVYDMEADDEST